MCACVYVRREGRKNTFGQTCQVFVAAWYARNVFHVYISTSLTVVTPLTESGKGD